MKATRTLNATITKAGKTGCHGCGRHFVIGERVLCYRERATSNGEARAYGTLYPKRFRCVDCLGREVRAFNAIMAEDAILEAALVKVYGHGSEGPVGAIKPICAICQGWGHSPFNKAIPCEICAGTGRSKL